MMLTILPLLWGFFAFLKFATEDMTGGSELSVTLGFAVVVQKKPSTTICLGMLMNSTTVITSALCEVGMEPVVDYHVITAKDSITLNPNEAPPFEIETVQRGMEDPFDIKTITLNPPGIAIEGDITAANLVANNDTFLDHLLNPIPAVALDFGPPFKTGVVEFSAWQNEACQGFYAKVKDPSWPEEIPGGVMCILTGTEELKIWLMSKRVTISPGMPCDGAIGSAIYLTSDFTVLGIVLKAFCGDENVTFALGGPWVAASQPASWEPPEPPTTTTTEEPTPTSTVLPPPTKPKPSMALPSITSSFLSWWTTIFCNLLLLHI